MKIRTFNAEFKSKVVLEVLRGEKELNHYRLKGGRFGWRLEAA